MTIHIPTPPPSPAALRSGVSPTRLEKLARGINASHWFAQAHQQQYTKAHLQSYNTIDDIRLIKSIGFSHIRFTLNPAILLNREQPDQLNAEFLGYVNDALDMMLGEGLAVIVDLHPEDDFKRDLLTRPEAVAEFVTFWGALAKNLSHRDPEMVFLEVLNEPVLHVARQWNAIQEKAVAVIRENAPDHTIIVSGYAWSGLYELLTVTPFADRNIVYNFHFYDPHIFTHQGATWGAPWWPLVQKLPYPSNPEVVAPVLETIVLDNARQQTETYGLERWNYNEIDGAIVLAANWAKQHGVPLTCNEFGVYRAKSLPEHRLAWIHDVRTVLEKYGIGWTMWDYAGGFSVVTTDGDRRVVDWDTAEALGFKRDANGST